MKYLILLIVFAILISGCEKDDPKSYSAAVTETINVKSVAMETIYQLVDLHIVNANNSSIFIDHCISVNSDTLAGMVSDTIDFSPDYQCPYLVTGNTSGGYSSQYPVSFPTINQPVIIELRDFITNGYTISGSITYTFVSQNQALISVNGLSVSNSLGTTIVDADFSLAIQAEDNKITGTISGTGDYPFSWESVSDLFADNDHTTYSFYGNFLIHTGFGRLTTPEKVLKENYGNGQEDDLVVFENEEMDRRAFVLPRL